MKKMLLSMIMTGALCHLYADDNSARNYGLLITDSAHCKYLLLGTKAVQEQLQITRSQIKLLKSAVDQDIEDIPGYAKFASLKKQKLKAASSDKERNQIDEDEDEAFNNRYLEAAAQSALSKAQGTNLDQLLRQMKGPCIILEDTNLIQQLSLSEEQVTNMQEVSEEYEYFLGELRHRSLGLQIATLRPRSDSDLQSELKSVFHVLKEVEKDEDYEILVLLQPEQKALWKKLCGTPMSIDWKAPESIGDFDVF